MNLWTDGHRECRGHIKVRICVKLKNLFSLWWFLHGAVGVEGLQLLLDAQQGVGELPVVEDDDGLFDPFQQVRGQRLVLFYHFLCLDGIVQNLDSKKKKKKDKY